LDAVDANGDTCLHIAAGCGSLNSLLMLLSSVVPELSESEESQDSTKIKIASKQQTDEELKAFLNQ
jgi:ankyrin repeat protein